MRGLLKMVSAVTCGVGHIPSRCLCGRPPAPLGGRILTNPKDIFQHNMWDHVQWSPEEIEKARQKAEENSREQIPIEEQVRYDKDANKYWDRFYEMHQNKFFKNRQWLFSEFPELLPQRCATSRTPEGQKATVPAFSEVRETLHSRMESQQGGSCIPNHDVLKEKQHHKTAAFPGQHASFRILEVGCGAGNSVFPIINAIRGSDAFLYCFDFSSQAIQLVREHPDYDPAVCHAFVHDICDVSMLPFPQESLDVIAVVFVLSSVHPERMQKVLNRLAGYLKHGGIILFRDYGRYDLAQLRFKKGNFLMQRSCSEALNLSLFLKLCDEIHQLFTNAGLEEVQNLEDRRLQVNRGKKMVMHRVWMQSKYRKPYRVSPGS